MTKRKALTKIEERPPNEGEQALIDEAMIRCKSRRERIELKVEITENGTIDMQPKFSDPEGAAAVMCDLLGTQSGDAAIHALEALSSVGRPRSGDVTSAQVNHALAFVARSEE